ncbi:MAG: hypothetical protein ACJ74G_20675 [Blastocatellia bacterium]
MPLMCELPKPEPPVAPPPGDLLPPGPEPAEPPSDIIPTPELPDERRKNMPQEKADV